MGGISGLCWIWIKTTLSSSISITLHWQLKVIFIIHITFCSLQVGARDTILLECFVCKLLPGRVFWSVVICIKTQCRSDHLHIYILLSLTAKWRSEKYTTRNLITVSQHHQSITVSLSTEFLLFRIPLVLIRELKI